MTHALGYLTTTILGIYYMMRDKIHMGEFMKRDEEPKAAREPASDLAG